MTLTRSKPLARTGRLKPVSDKRANVVDKVAGYFGFERKAPLPKVSPKRRAYRQSAEGKAGLEHMRRVRALPCVICTVEGLAQLSETQAHHVICGRYSARKAPDTHTIPLCEGHHQGLRDTSKVAIHQAPSKWQRLYGPDTDFLALTADMLAGELTPVKE